MTYHYSVDVKAVYENVKERSVLFIGRPSAKIDRQVTAVLPANSAQSSEPVAG
jgi:hypothetical protein